MTFGILTFHSQLNYGGVLQALALQQVLGQFGDVQVIDRWMSADNHELTCGYPRFGRRGWVRFVFRALLGLGEFGRALRSRRTLRFHRRYFRLTPYHFWHWQELSDDIKGCLPDCLVVGSDQVWNCETWANPRPYLLEGVAPKHAIAYAASFGKTKIPVAFLDLYARGLKRFEAISCREKQGVGICQAFGLCASHVVDPTLLVEPEYWQRLVAKGTGRNRLPRRSKNVFCYLLSEDLDAAWDLLEHFAHEQKCRIEVFSDEPPVSWWVPYSLRPANIRTWAKALKRRFFSPVRLRVSAGPLEFLAALSMADGVVSDSFHALMFSIVFNRNVRIIRPTTEERKEMFARIEEFDSMSTESCICDGLEQALKDVVNRRAVRFDPQLISRRRGQSHAWLAHAISQLK